MVGELTKWGSFFTSVSRLPKQQSRLCERASKLKAEHLSQRSTFAVHLCRMRLSFHDHAILKTPDRFKMSSPIDPPLDEPPLPPGFLSIQDIRNLPNEKIAAKIMIKNIVGFVKDFRPPIPTRGTGMGFELDIKYLSNLKDRYEVHNRNNGLFNSRRDQWSPD